MPTATKPKPREVVLLTCPDPTCRRVSRVDATAFHGTKGKSWGSGPIDAGHKKRKCEPVVFREVVS